MEDSFVILDQFGDTSNDIEVYGIENSDNKTTFLLRDKPVFKLFNHSKKPKMWHKSLHKTHSIIKTPFGVVTIPKRK